MNVHARHAEPGESLSFTVHTMPKPEGDAATGQTAAAPNRRSRLMLWLVLIVCAAPVVASYFTYYVIRPEGRRNFGELIAEQPTLPTVSAQRFDGTEVPLTSLAHQWLLVSVAGGACDAACEHHLYLQRQLLTALGKDRDRTEWVWLVDDATPVRPALLPALKDATVLRVPPSTLKAWLKPEAGHSLHDHLFVVDPFGRWMMRFPAKLDTTGATRAKRDLERLMRASNSWDQAGRPASFVAPWPLPVEGAAANGAAR